MAAKQKSNKPRSRRPRPFTGILARPMVPPRPPRNQPSDETALALWLEQRDEYLNGERVKRIDALLERYGIDESDKGRPSADVLLQLVMALIEDLDIPGFRIANDRPKGGRPITWNFAAKARLLHEVAAARSGKRRRTERAVCFSLTAPGKPYSRYRPESLHRLYQKIKKENPGLVRMVELVAQGRGDEIQVVGFRPTIKVSG